MVLTVILVKNEDDIKLNRFLGIFFFFFLKTIGKTFSLDFVGFFFFL